MAWYWILLIIIGALETLVVLYILAMVVFCIIDDIKDNKHGRLDRK